MGGVGSWPVVFGCCLALAACSDAAPAADPEAPLLPQVAPAGGPVMAHPALVPIFFLGEPDAGELTRFSSWIVGSQWLAAVGTEYGVGAGSVLGAVDLMDGPDLSRDDKVVDLLFDALAMQQIPRPADGDLSNVLYMVYLSPFQTITFRGSTSCVDFDGYHSSARRGGEELVYAVIASCPAPNPGAGLQTRESIASHELIEAATDPFPITRPAFRVTERTNPWVAFGGEVADLCEVEGDPDWRENGFVAQRSWSNDAATAGRDPCVPGQDLYFNVSPSLRTAPRIQRGDHLKMQLTAFASNAADGFSWSIEAHPITSHVPTLLLGTEKVHAGATTSLDIGIDAAAPNASSFRAFVESIGASVRHILPMFVNVGPPCSTYSTCETCAQQGGCGWCGTTGTCEAQDESGSGGSCPASSLATWPGSCSDFCAAHGDTCIDCSMQVGCGWCDGDGAPRCLEADRVSYQARDGSCSYASWSFTPSYCP